MASIWDYPDPTWSEGSDFVGYDVEATDGSIGSIDEASNEAGGSYVAVDTGFWIFGKKRLIPAGAVTSVDHLRRVVNVSMSKDAIHDAPDFESDGWNVDARGSHDDYYGDRRRWNATMRGDDNPLV